MSLAGGGVAAPPPPPRPDGQGALRAGAGPGQQVRLLERVGQRPDRLGIVATLVKAMEMGHPLTDLRKRERLDRLFRCGRCEQVPAQLGQQSRPGIVVGFLATACYRVDD